MNRIRRLMIEFLKTLADQTRLEILQILKNGEKSSSEIQEILNKSQSTISQHLKVLINHELIESFQKDTILEIENSNKKEKISRITKSINYYKIKSADIFELLLKFQSYVINTNKIKINDIRDLDIIDTLF
ncbi:MAG: winged helix-turn-helix transcriptional regulator [Candidatus Lokiarchaeota archaeon]|nr:winged helix-turn-helix transcriptional regulator [Candidatus Lokiarchaeota archaeon]